MRTVGINSVRWICPDCSHVNALCASRIDGCEATCEKCHQTSFVRSSAFNTEREQTVRDFVEYVQGQRCEPPDWLQNVKLTALEITNNSANDYRRSPTDDELERLIGSYLAR